MLFFIQLHGRTLSARDDAMETPPKNPALRQGQFYWMNESAKKSYLSVLKKRIEEGYYFSDKVVTRIVDEIAPVLNDCLEHDGLMS